MTERGCFPAQRFENGQLYACVGDVILATDDMRDGERDIVDDAGECIEIRAIRANKDGIGQRADIDDLIAADEIVPADNRRLGSQALPRSGIGQAEPPVRGAPLGFEPAALLFAQLQRGAIVDRWLAERALAATLAGKFVLGLIAGIKKPSRLQTAGSRIVELRAIGLPFLPVPGESEPQQIVTNALRELVRRAFQVGVVEPQNEAACIFARKQPVERGGTHVADVETACRARRKAEDGVHIFLKAWANFERHPSAFFRSYRATLFLSRRRERISRSDR